jgi:nucleoside-diphosphate-sugar epimerase
VLTYLVELARHKSAAGYVGEGAERWAAAHRLDVARLCRLALEKGTVDGIYHAADEEGVPMRQVIEVIGKALNVRVNLREMYNLASRSINPKRRALLENAIARLGLPG